jgi:YidC/Oxa1 family membrane protein insertase
VSLIKSFFSVTIFQPLFNALILLYLLIPDLGVAIILLTVIIKLLLLPTSRKAIESQKKMQEIQPEVKELQKKYKDNRQLQSQKIMELYKKKNVNPASGCLPMIVQLVFLIALYQVFLTGLGSDDIGQHLYGFVKSPQQLDPIAFGFLDLSVPNNFLALVVAALQFVQGKMMLKKQELKKSAEKKKVAKKDSSGPAEPEFAELFQKQILYMGPLFTLLIGNSFSSQLIGITIPSGLILYWGISTIFMIIQQYQVFKKEGVSLMKTSKPAAN